MKVSFSGNRFVDFYSLWNSHRGRLSSFLFRHLFQAAHRGIPDGQNSHRGPDQTNGNNDVQPGSCFSKWFRRGGDKSRPGRTSVPIEQRCLRLPPVAEPASRRMFKNLFDMVAHGPRAFRPSKGCSSTPRTLYRTCCCAIS